eukprot:scaffold5086_cov118-Isochrysis_galbana.AAC.3
MGRCHVCVVYTVCRACACAPSNQASSSAHGSLSEPRAGGRQEQRRARARRWARPTAKSPQRAGTRTSHRAIRVQ